MSDYLYALDGDRAVPSALTMGPWSAEAQHGGPPSALLTYLAEQLLEPEEHLGRIHIDLLAGVPLEPLMCESTRHQKSRRVAHVDASLSHEGRVVAAARALVVRQSNLADSHVPPVTVKFPEPSAVATIDPPSWLTPADATPFHSDAVEHKFISGAFAMPGPATDWIRLGAQVVEGEDPSGAQRVAAVADLGSGISAVYDPAAGIGMINTDVDIGFVGPPSGNWFCLDSRTEVSGSGTGLALTKIYDETRQLVAVATQSLLGRRLG